jgi:hypothetical protein
MPILKTLEPTPLHGVGIARRIEAVTRGTFLVEPGSMFPARHQVDTRFFPESVAAACSKLGPLTIT